MDKVLVEYNSSSGVFFQHRLLDREYTVRISSHAQFEFLYLIKGEMELEVNEQKRKISAGELVLIKPNAMHLQRMHSGIETELMVVQFLPSFLPSMVKYEFVDFVSESPVLNHCLPHSITSKYKFFDIFKKISSLSKKKDLTYRNLYVCAEILKLVATLSEAIDGMGNTSAVQEEKPGQPMVVAKCLSYLNTNIAKKISVDELADYLCCSKSYLQHVFKREMGCSISEYVNIQKMTIAKSLLKSSLTPSEISDRLGYEYYSTFSAKFKKFYGAAPKLMNPSEILLNKDMEKMEPNNKKTWEDK